MENVIDTFFDVVVIISLLVVNDFHNVVCNQDISENVNLYRRVNADRRTNEDV